MLSSLKSNDDSWFHRIQKQNSTKGFIVDESHFPSAVFQMTNTWWSGAPSLKADALIVQEGGAFKNKIRSSILQRESPLLSSFPSLWNNHLRMIAPLNDFWQSVAMHWWRGHCKPSSVKGRHRRRFSGHFCWALPCQQIGLHLQDDNYSPGEDTGWRRHCGHFCNADPCRSHFVHCIFQQ